LTEHLYQLVTLLSSNLNPLKLDRVQEFGETNLNKEAEMKNKDV